MYSDSSHCYQEDFMKVFVTGASGWIGSALVPELVGAGHTVVGLARSDNSATTITAMGAFAVRGDIGDLDLLSSTAADSDGVIHLAFGHSSDMAAAAAETGSAIAVIGDALEGTDKPFIVASGTPNLNGRVATEADAALPVGPAGARVANALATVDLAARGVRSSVMRIPRTVHGQGDKHGFIPQLITLARERGVSGYVGDGSSRWPAIHIADAAALFRAALEKAPAGSVLHAVGEEGVRTRDIAEAIGRHLDLPVQSAAPADLGFLGLVLAGDQPASSILTQEALDWKPTNMGLIEDINEGHYFA
jgi:nucleoside-diphosphate-sugar epimerase